ncbi:MAG TPA: hypothetical protein VFV87_04930, partial [Pirellulaceae bacterium]|nr:hypothetical protein [Pirellulaceae bacterium]
MLNRRRHFMTRVHKTVLWTLAACVFGYIAVHVLIVKAPGPALAQQPPEEPAGAIPLPEDDRGGPGEERAAPASALEPARALVAVCVGDKGEPLDDVIVDIVRETATESPFDPRVEPYGQATSKDGGRLSFALPPIRHRITGQAGIYILYFTAPGRPIKSVVVENDTALPKEIAIPKESAEHVYAPTHHIVVAKSKGISISPLHSAIRAFTKDGKIYRVVEFVDERTGVDKAPGKQTASGSWKPSPANPEDDVASMTIPKTGNGGRYGAGYGGSMADSGMPMSPPAAQDRITSARQKLTDARTDKEKQAARAQLRKLLAEIFAQDMQMREQQAAEIESRLANLRRQYQAREKVKEEIIDLQLKVIEQDAAGLGFPGGGPGFPGGLPRSGVGGSGFQSGGQGAMTAPQPAGRRSGVSVERPLAEFKQQQALIGELNKYGHFAESTDGKLYAHVSSNHPRGPSFIFVVDSQTGKLVGTAAVNSVVGPILFTKEGLASRENDLLELRIRLTRRAGPDGDVFEVGSADLNPFDPMTVALDPEFLKKYSSKPQARVGELAARGHFVGSPDGKLYAYVETSGDNMPERSALVRVCDVRTGQRVAGTRIKPPVGKLRFFNHGVFTEDADGKLTLRIRLNRRTGPEGDVFEVGSADLNPVDPLTVITAGGDVVELPGTANGATHSLRADMAA